MWDIKNADFPERLDLIYYSWSFILKRFKTNKKQLAVKQLTKNVIGINFSVYAISSSDFWNYLQI